MATKKTKEPENVKAVVPAAPTAIVAMSEEEQELLSRRNKPFMSARDMLIAKILPIQKMSKKVDTEEAEFGELRDTVTNELYGDFDTPMSFIPLEWRAMWVEQKAVGAGSSLTWEYIRSIPVTAENDNWPLDDKNGADVIKRTRNRQFFILTLQDIEGGTPVPKMIQFRSTSTRGGKKLIGQMEQINPMAKLPPWGMVMRLKVTKESNDKGTYAVIDVEQERPATPAERKLAFDWWKIVSQSTDLKVDQSDEVEAASEAPAFEAGVHTGTF